jgi:hypothetical protein
MRDRVSEQEKLGTDCSWADTEKNESEKSKVKSTNTSDPEWRAKWKPAAALALNSRAGENEESDDIETGLRPAKGKTKLATAGRAAPGADKQRNSDPATPKNPQHNWDLKEQFFYWT